MDPGKRHGGEEPDPHDHLHLVRGGHGLAGEEKITARAKTATIKGLATGSVARIEWRLGVKGAYRPAAGSTAWTIKVTKLAPGRNTVQIRGVDTNGGTTAPVTVTVTMKAKTGRR